MNMENEKYYRDIFPNLNEFYLYPNSESNDFNCISHVLGVYDMITWPTIHHNFYWLGVYDVSVESFDNLFKRKGFEKLDILDITYDENLTKIALFTNNGLPTHASLQIDEDWLVSKIGSLGIIKHDLFEIENSKYGIAKYIYVKRKYINEKILNFNEYFNNINFEKL